jgi:hypothetical protein
MKAKAKENGVTINDLTMAVVSKSLKDYLKVQNEQ